MLPAGEPVRGIWRGRFETGARFRQRAAHGGSGSGGGVMELHGANLRGAKGVLERDVFESGVSCAQMKAKQKAHRFRNELLLGAGNRT